VSGDRAKSTTRGQRAFIGAAIVGFTLLSAYLVLVIITHVDTIFAPGTQITIPGAPKSLPLVDTQGESGSDEPINILVLGLDRRPREGEQPSRTDTIFVVRVDPKQKMAAILGVPRDLWVDVPYATGGGTYKERINAAYVIGELGDYDGGGIGLVKEIFASDPLNIEIDHHVVVDFTGFERLIDALGGIDVDIPEDISDPYYSWTERPGDYDPQYFEAGRQHMDGRTALAYSRIRFNSDDFDRIQRQQRVIFAAIEKASSLNVLKDATKLWSEYKDAIETDISDIKIPGYAAIANRTKDNIHAVSLGPATAPYTTPQGAAVLIGDPDGIRDIIESVFADAPAADATAGAAGAEPVFVQVQNGTGQDGLASRVVAYIASRGYPVDELNAANTFDGLSHVKSEIIDVSGANHRNAFLLATWLKIPAENVRDATEEERAVIAASPAGTPEIIIILGSDSDFVGLIQGESTAAAEG
jgi:LCP family protein required for cell wall assembly